MKKSCENCFYKSTDGEALLCNNVNNCCGHSRWKPDYPTLEQENVELTQALERACKWILHISRDCNLCPLKTNCPGGNYGLNCLESLKKHFKEAPQ